MNEIMMNRMRETWSNEMVGRTTHEELTPQQRELLYWVTSETEARLRIQAAVLEKTFIMTEFGLTPENYSFREINQYIIKLEDELHMIKVKAREVRKRYNENK